MARHSRSFWEQRDLEVERGAPLETVARRHGVKAKTLQWWRYELRRARRGAESLPALLPVVVRDRPEAHASAPVEIAVGRSVVRVTVGTDVEYVAALVGAMGRRC